MTLSNGGPAEVKLNAIEKAIQRSDLSQTEKLVLAGIILRANDDLREAKAGAAILVRYASLKRRDAVFAAITALEQYGLIKRQSQGNGRSNMYDVVPDRLADAAIDEWKMAGSGWVDPSCLPGRVEDETRPVQADGSTQNPSGSGGRVEIIPVRGLPEAVRVNRTASLAGRPGKQDGLANVTRPVQADGLAACSNTHASVRAEFNNYYSNSTDRPEIEEPPITKSPLSEIASDMFGMQPDTPKKPKKVADYSAEFLEFWGAYPETSGMSKLNAWKRWQTTSPENRKMALAAIPAFKADLDKRRRTQSGATPLHAEGFLNQKRYETLVGPETPASGQFWWRDEKRVATMTPERWRTGIETYANGRWPIDKLGPPPGAAGCLVPPNLAAEMRLEDFYAPTGILKDPAKHAPWAKH